MYKWQRQAAGNQCIRHRSSGFVRFLQNHDQVANTARGERPNILATAGRYKAMTALLVLAPARRCFLRDRSLPRPTPFLIFAITRQSYSKMVREGRGKFLSSVSQPRSSRRCSMSFGDPGNPSYFRSVGSSIFRNARRTLPHVLSSQRPDKATPGGSRVPPTAAWRVWTVRCSRPSRFSCAISAAPHGDRLLLVNLGRDLHLDPAPEPLSGTAAKILVGPSSGRARIPGTAATVPTHRRAKTIGGMPGNSAIVLRS